MSFSESRVDLSEFLARQRTTPEGEIKPRDEEFLKSKEGGRAIWARVFPASDGRPERVILGLIILDRPLVQAAITYGADGKVIPHDMSVSVGHAHAKPFGSSWFSLYPREVYFCRTWGGYGWARGGSSGPSDESDPTFDRFIAQGLYPPETLTRSIDLSASFDAFVRRLQGFMNDPESFEPVRAPQIPPVLVDTSS